MNESCEDLEHDDSVLRLRRLVAQRSRLLTFARLSPLGLLVVSGVVWLASSNHAWGSSPVMIFLALSAFGWAALCYVLKGIQRSIQQVLRSLVTVNAERVGMSAEDTSGVLLLVFGVMGQFAVAVGVLLVWLLPVVSGQPPFPWYGWLAILPLVLLLVAAGRLILVLRESSRVARGMPNHTKKRQ